MSVTVTGVRFSYNYYSLYTYHEYGTSFLWCICYNYPGFHAEICYSLSKIWERRGGVWSTREKVYIAGFFQNLLVVSDASEHLISSEIQYLFFILFIYWSRNFLVAARIIFNFNLAKYAKKKWRIIAKNELALLHPRFSTSFAQFLAKFYPSFYSLFTTNVTLQSYRYYVAISIVNVLIRSNLFFQSFRTVYT